MKRTIISVAAIVLGGLLAVWAQPNGTEGDPITPNVYPVMIIQGDTVTGGAVETDPNHITEFEVLSSPVGFTYDVNEVNTLQFQYVSDLIGIETAYIRATVTSPYKGRPVIWAIQIDTRSDLVPKLEWFHNVVQ